MESFSYFPSVLRYGILVDETVKSEEHRQRFSSPCFETCFKKKCDRRLSFFHFYPSYPILKPYPQIESTSQKSPDVCLKLRNKHTPKKTIERAVRPYFCWLSPPWFQCSLGGKASMLSAETIKEHDVRQNAGAQRLLKAGWKVDVELNKRCKETDCVFN